MNFEAAELVHEEVGRFPVELIKVVEYTARNDTYNVWWARTPDDAEWLVSFKPQAGVYPRDAWATPLEFLLHLAHEVVEVVLSNGSEWERDMLERIMVDFGIQ